MGESAVLLRSFSHPSDASREAKEGDPIRALTESISFGRFVSDSLAWEKWSTFSHNRYLEEVEKFSKPGSVAEKKAYFEAHYRRKAAVKAAAIHEANSAAKDGPELKNTSDICNDSQMDESVKADSHVAIHDEKDQHISNADTTSSMDTALATINSRVVIDERTEKDLPDIEVAESGDANACNSTNVGNKVDDADLERGLPVIECAINVENPTQSENFKQLKNADIRDKIVATPVQSNLKNEAVDEENLASSGKKKRSNWSSKSSTKTVASRLASHPSKQTHSLPPKSVNSVVINSKKSVGDLNEKKRVVPKTVHMSINFASDASETSKCSSKFSKDSSTPIRNSIRASFNGVSKHLSKILQSEDKRYLYRRNIHDRSKTLVNKSDSGGRAEDEKFYSLSMDSQSSRANESKARPPSISSPFSFRSEERAAKRKEFFQKLQEKNNVKEAEKAQLETRLKGKSENGNEMLRQSTGFKVKPNEDLNCGLTSPRNRMKKIHLTQPTPTAAHDGSFRPPRRPSISTESSKHAREKIYGSTTRSITSLPKLVRKPTTNMVQDATRPPWRSSMSTTGLKRVMEKNNRTTTVSVTSLPKKNAHENASPNIQC